MALYEDVVARLTMLGHAVTESQQAAVTYAINLAAETITAKINRKEIPEGLHYIHIDMAAGLFLKSLKDTGQLTLEFLAPAKRITEGDATVEFATNDSTTPEALFNNLVNGLITPPESVFAAYRRLKW